MNILVLGKIWEPGMGICAYNYQPGSSALTPPLAARPVTRELVQAWLDANAGDFQSIHDFTLTDYEGKTIVDWKLPDSEQSYCDTIFGCEDV